LNTEKKASSKIKNNNSYLSRKTQFEEKKNPFAKGLFFYPFQSKMCDFFLFH